MNTSEREDEMYDLSLRVEVLEKGVAAILKAGESKQAASPTVLSMDRIVEVVAAHFGVPVEDIMGRGKPRQVALARRTAMYLVRRIMGRSYPEIGKFFGRHHSTVMYADSRTHMQRVHNVFCASNLARIEQELKGEHHEVSTQA